MRWIASLRWAVIFMVPLQLATASVSLADRQSLQTRPGVTVAVDLRAAEDAAVLVLLFEGGGGRINPNSKGFAHLAHKRFAKEGIATALIDAPSDQRQFMGGMHPSFRVAEAHLTDIDTVVAALRTQTNLPIWFLGISLGTRSAANYAVKRSDRIAGVVLLSSSTNNPRGKPIDRFPLNLVTVPLLAIAHKDDVCSGTPPAGAQRIVAASTASPDAALRIFAGGRNTGRRPCGTETYHTFFGIEDEVISAIAAFVVDHTP